MMNWLGFLGLAGLLTIADAWALSFLPLLDAFFSDPLMFWLAGATGILAAAMFRKEIIKRDGWWIGRAIGIGWLSAAIFGFVLGCCIVVQGDGLIAPVLLPFVFAVMVVPTMPLFAPLSIGTVAALRPLATRLQVRSA